MTAEEWCLAHASQERARCILEYLTSGPVMRAYYRTAALRNGQKARRIARRMAARPLELEEAA